MRQDHLILELFKGDLIADTAAVILFIAVYTILAPWWKHPIGRTLVMLDIFIGLGLLPSVMSLFFHFSRLTSLVAGWLDVVVWAAIAVLLLLRIPLWIRLHRAGRVYADEDDHEQQRP